VWFAISHGILNEIYYSRVDQACTRDLGLIVTDGRTFFSEEKRDTRSHVEHLSEGVPGYRLINTCAQWRYRIEKEIVSDPERAAVLQQTRFVPLRDTLADYHLYVILAPHLGNRGSGNTAWVGDYKGMPMLMAERDGIALALASSVPWLHRSVGFVGVSDGWQDLVQHKQMTWSYTRAENGNVAQTGEVDLRSTDGNFVLAVGFGRTTAEAGHRARASLFAGFEYAKATFIRAWQSWQSSLLPMEAPADTRRDLYRISTAVLGTHEAKRFHGGTIASLSIPWGFAKGDDDLGGYHLVWPRDLVETAGGLLAAGAREEARRVISYLQTTQDADGHWAQNMWLDGTPYWNGIQMDETALPILLADRARREGALNSAEVERYWPMVRRAASFLVCNGPVTQEDRWEMDPGYSPFTLAAEIAALLTAADWAEFHGEAGPATYLRETADLWNNNIERWIYVSDTELARQVGVKGYYLRVAPPEEAEAASPAQGFVPIKNRPPGTSDSPAAQLISPDALALVRFGLRAPDDPRVVDTRRVVDALLKIETPYGPAWRRYTGDRYGEYQDGSPFDGGGVGRAWPLLTGERAHYELAAGRREEAIRLLSTLESFANEGGMIAEQIWDAPDIPQRELCFGRPSGSAMPLVWAHAEYIKLRRSLRDGRVFDMPPQPVRRYLVDKTGSAYSMWRFSHKCHRLCAGRILRVEVLSPAIVRWTADGWQTVHNTHSTDSGLGIHLADLTTARLTTGTAVEFTLYWPETGQWEDTNYTVIVE
jgi:glucoamylase